MLGKGISLDDYHLLPILVVDAKYDNTSLISVLVKLLSLPSEIIEKKLEKIFKKKGEEVVEKNKSLFQSISANYVLPVRNLFGSFTQRGEGKKITYGNKVIAYGAIDNGLSYYSAYPMTPASSILTEVINSKKVTYLQAEDEIAVVNSALGASFTGARVMAGTSGGGFALMTEAISFAIQAEIPLTLVLAQRAGPSTGTPTFHEQ